MVGFGRRASSKMKLGLGCGRKMRRQFWGALRISRALAAGSLRRLLDI